MRPSIVLALVGVTTVYAFHKSALAPACDPETALENFFTTASSYIETAVESFGHADSGKTEQRFPRDVDAATHATFGYLTALAEDAESWWNDNVYLGVGCDLLDNSSMLASFEYVVQMSAMNAMRTVIEASEVFIHLYYECSEAKGGEDALVTTAQAMAYAFGQVSGISALAVLAAIHSSLGEPMAAWTAWLQDVDMPMKSNSTFRTDNDTCEASSTTSVLELPHDILSSLATTYTSPVTHHPALEAFLAQMTALLELIVLDATQEMRRFGCVVPLCGVIGRALASDRITDALQMLITELYEPVVSDEQSGTVIKRYIKAVVTGDTGHFKHEDRSLTVSKGFYIVFPKGWNTTESTSAAAVLQPGYTMLQQLQFIHDKLTYMLVYDHGDIDIPGHLAEALVKAQFLYDITVCAVWEHSDAVQSLYTPLVQALKLHDLELVRYTLNLIAKTKPRGKTAMKPMHRSVNPGQGLFL
eukprot:18684-Heterococcus_DN1.PRE.5